MRRVLIVVLVLAVAAGGGVATYLLLSRPTHGGPSSGPASSPTATASAPPALPSRAPVLTGLTAPATRPQPAAVAAALRRPATAKALGKRLYGEAIDVTTGQVLWNDQDQSAAPPASTAKLLTAVAALTVLGPDQHLQTRVVRRGRTIWLVGGGDVTWGTPEHPPASAGVPSPSVAYPVAASVSDLAGQTVRALRGAGVRSVRLDLDDTAESGPVLAPGWKASYLSEGDVAAPSALEVDEGRVAPGAVGRVGDPTTAAGATFATALSRRGITVKGSPAVKPAPSSAQPVADVDSPTIAALVQQMLTVSDDDLAEALARAVARAGGRPGTFAAGAKAVLAADRAAGVDTTGVRLVDGSGLSRDDRVRPANLESLLRIVGLGRDPRLAAISEGLPIAGFSGTLADRYEEPPQHAGAGIVRAKTGTLDGVSALAGLVVDRSGDLLSFALLASRTKGAYLAEPALDRIAATLATCGCRAP